MSSVQIPPPPAANQGPRRLILDSFPLTERELAQLRVAYDAPTLLQLGERFLTAPYPAAGPWASFVMGPVYQSDTITPLERELVLTAILAGKLQPGTMAVHMYWALMEGAEPSALAHLMLLTGVYSGIDAYTIGQRTLHRLGGLLRDQVEAGRLDTVSVVSAILQLFPA